MSFGAVLGAKSSTQAHKRTHTHTSFAVTSCLLLFSSSCSFLFRKSHALSCQWMTQSCVHKRSPGQCANEPDVVHCNTLQYTATHCNILQHTAIHGNTLRKRARRHPQKSPTSSTNEPYIIPLSFQWTNQNCTQKSETTTKTKKSLLSIAKEPSTKEPRTYMCCCACGGALSRVRGFDYARIGTREKERDAKRQERCALITE